MGVVAAPIENLVFFIQERARFLALNQREVAEHSRLDAGILNNLLTGRMAKAPPIDMLEALGKGLRVDADLLIAIVRGRAGATTGELASLVKLPIGAKWPPPPPPPPETEIVIVHSPPKRALLELTLVDFVGDVGRRQMLAFDQPDPLEVPSALAAGIDFVARARGETMTRYEIFAGDLLYCARCEAPESVVHQIVIARIESEGAVCMALEPAPGGGLMLVTSGRQQHDAVAVDERVMVLGVVKWVAPYGWDPSTRAAGVP